MSKKIKRILIAWDTGLAVVSVIALVVLVDRDVSASFAKDIVGVGISVLSIVFLVFFASLTFIISSSNDEFVEFLIEKGHYKSIIWSFKWTLGALFFALSFSLIFYVHLSYIPKDTDGPRIFWSTSFFIGAFVYSLVASASATNDAIKYAIRRDRFIRITGDENDN